MQNEKVSYFEECLSLGRYLSQAEKEALYQYLLESKRETYKTQATTLLKDGFLMVNFANGEIQYGIDTNSVYYMARKVNSAEFTPALRRLKIKSPSFLKTRRLQRFFAQAEVDVLSNFPLPGVNQESGDGYGINAIPFYDLNYYSNGDGKMRGLIRRIENSNSEILSKLRTL